MLHCDLGPPTAQSMKINSVNFPWLNDYNKHANTQLSTACKHTVLACTCFHIRSCIAGASLFTYGKLGRNVYLCVAVKMKIIIFEINNSKSRYEKKKEVSIHSHALSLQMFNEKLCVGYQSGFSLIHVYADERPQSELRCVCVG